MILELALENSMRGANRHKGWLKTKRSSVIKENECRARGYSFNISDSCMLMLNPED